MKPLDLQMVKPLNYKTIFIGLIGNRKKRLHYGDYDYFPTTKLIQYFICRCRGRKIKKNLIRIKK